MLAARCCFGALLAWSVAATAYIAFQDDIAASMASGRDAVRIDYEDRIAEAKAKLEREVTASLVERRSFAARLEAVASRQSEIELRQAWLQGLADRLAGRPTGRAMSSASTATVVEPETTGSVPKTSPAFTIVSPEASGKPAPLPIEPFDLRLRSGEEPGRLSRIGERLSRLEHDLRRVSDAALGSAETLRREAHGRSQRVRIALGATRVDTRRIVGQDAPMGGPLVPLPRGFDAAAFDPLATDAEAGLAEFERLSAVARALPLAKPMAGALEQTSGFGYRLDPFTRGPALHTGLDFRAEPGGAVVAAAAGRVTAAEYTGGYGKMVEVEHEGGVATRYGHLSAYAVAPGQTVAAGQLVGRAGSTGRSTGTHLHYETRIDGEPVNPARFLEAGRLLAAGPTD